MAERTLIIPDGYGIIRVTCENRDSTEVFWADLIPYKRGPWLRPRDVYYQQTSSYQDGTGYPVYYQIKWEVLT